MLADSVEVVRLSAAVTLERTPAYRAQVIGNLLSAVSSTTLSSALRLHAVRHLQYCQLRSADSANAASILTAAGNDPDRRIRETAARVLDALSKPPP